MKYLRIFVRWLYSFVRPRPAYYHKVEASDVSSPPPARRPRLIVALTSFPARAKTVSYTIETILLQSLRPDKVCLFLADSQFPKKEKSLPRRLRRLTKLGLEIHWCEDIRSYKKLIPALSLFLDDIIVTADDDVYYPPEWLARLYAGYQSDPSKIYCHRASRIYFNADGTPKPYNSWGTTGLLEVHEGFDVGMTGVGGVLYPPHSLHEDVDKKELFYTLAKDADDLWFWAMAVLKGTQVAVVKDNIYHYEGIFYANDKGLWASNQHNSNDDTLRSIYTHYPQLCSIIQQHVLNA